MFYNFFTKSHKKSNLLRKITNRTSSIARSASRTRISGGISYTTKNGITALVTPLLVFIVFRSARFRPLVVVLLVVLRIAAGIVLGTVLLVVLAVRVVCLVLLLVIL